MKHKKDMNGWLEKAANKKISGQNFEITDIYPENDLVADPTDYVVIFEAKNHSGRKLKGYVKRTENGWDVENLRLMDPGFAMSDADYERIARILGQMFKKTDFIIIKTGYFKDTEDTAYKEDGLVYADAVFYVWLDAKCIVDEKRLHDLLKANGVLGMEMEMLPKKLFKGYEEKYDSDEIFDYYDKVHARIRIKGAQIQRLTIFTEEKAE